MIRSTHLALVSIALACAGVVAFSASPAFAQDQATVDKLVQMNKKALDDFDTLDFDAAKKILLDALQTGRKAGLDTHPVMARTYIHLGAVYITGFKDHQKALQSFGRAIEIDPQIQLSKGIETAEVTAAFAEAQRNARGGGASGGDQDNAPPPPKKKHRGPIMEGDETAGTSDEDHPKPKKRHHDQDEEPDLPAHINALDCPQPDEAIIDKPLTLRCAVAPSLPVASVYLLYHLPGKEDYTDILMTKTPKGWLQAKIPKKAITGKSVQFYFEGRNDDGKPVVANGGADGPNIVPIVEAEAAGETGKLAGEDVDENPLEPQDGGPQGPRLHLGHVDTSREGLDTRYGKRKFWIGLGIGTGYGYAKGNGFEAVNRSIDPSFHGLQNQFTPGLAWAGVAQLEPEFGYAITPDMALSIAGRLQYTAPPAKYAQFTYKGAIGVLAKLLFYTKQSQLRFYGGVLAGGGNFRFLGYPDAGATCVTNQPCFTDFKDTIAAGPILAGAAGGLYYEASKAASLVVELNEIAGFPTFGLVTDLVVSVQFNIYKSEEKESLGPKPFVPSGSDEEEPK